MKTYLLIFLVSIGFAVNAAEDHTPLIRGIVLMGDPSHLLDAAATEKMEGIWVEELDLPGNEKLLETLLTPVLTSKLNRKSLDYIEDQIFEYYREQGISSIKVTIPEEALKTGIVQIIIERIEEKTQFPVRGIVIVKDQKNLIYSKTLRDMEGIWIQEDGSDEASLEALLNPVLEQEFNEETIAYIQEKLSQYYQDTNHPIILSIPTQRKETGIIQIIAAEPIPEPTPPPPPPQVRGIVLLAEGTEMLDEKTLSEIEGVWADMPQMPNETVLEELLTPALGVKFDQEALVYIQAKILNHYRDSGGPDVHLTIPAQNEETGVVQIYIREEITQLVVEEETPVLEVETIAVAPCIEEESPPVEVIEEEPPGPKIRGIVLLGPKDDLLDPETLEGIEGILVAGLKLPGNESYLEVALQSILDEPFNEDTLCLIREQIYEYYRDSDRPFVLVEVPDQDEGTGVAQFIVQESTLGKVAVTGNNWTTKKRYENYFQLKPGEPISQRRLNRDVDFMNRNPYRFVNVIYSPGEKEYTTDLTLEVADRKPYFFYAGVDNTGVPTTGRPRVFAGFSWDQMFGLDHLFFYQYSTNYSSHKFHSNSFQYMAMLPMGHVFNLFGGFSITHADLDPMPMKNKGTTVQASIRYTIPFSPSQHFSQEIMAGFDIKNTNNTVEFTDTTPVFGHVVNITQWMAAYKCKYEWKKIEVESSIEAVFSPFAWLPDQTDEDFDSLRPNAKNTWFSTNVYCLIRRALPHAFSTQIKINGQYSPSTLLPSEQLGIGGYASVRGYDERQYNGDSGMLASWEVHSPHFSLFRAKKRALSNDAYFLAFSEGGFGFDNNHIPDVPNSNFLASIGAGFRYYFGTYINTRVDYGFKLHHQQDFTGGRYGHLHFSVSGSY